MTHADLKEKGTATVKVLYAVKDAIYTSYGITSNIDALNLSLALYDSLEAFDTAIEKAVNIGRY